jgi:hypothetical protein
MSDQDLFSPITRAGQEPLQDIIARIDELRAQDRHEQADELSDNIADAAQIREYVETVFKHATAGYVSLRCFIDREKNKFWHWPWRPQIATSDWNRHRIFL